MLCGTATEALEHLVVEVEHVPVQGVKNRYRVVSKAVNDLQPQVPAVEMAENGTAALGAEVEGEEFFGGGHGQCPAPGPWSMLCSECTVTGGREPPNLSRDKIVMRRFVEHIADGDSVEEVYLVVDKQLRANRNGNLYIQVDLRDRTGTINARLWNAGDQQFRSFESGDFLLVKGKAQLFQGSLQLILSQLERVDQANIELAEFLPHTSQDVSKLYERLCRFLRGLANPHLRALAESFLMDHDFTHALCHAPAGVRVHHAYVGGLLEHIVTLLDAADRLAPLYPALDGDLLKMGIFLHDVGKVRELSFDRAFAYTDEGQLIGHMVIGVEMLAERVRTVPDLTGEPFPVELLLRLKHLILSHHGTHEFGSPKVPMTPEAIALHYLDNFDAKLHTFTREIREDTNNSSAWTPFNAALQRRLFKGGAGASGVGPDGD